MIVDKIDCLRIVLNSLQKKFPKRLENPSGFDQSAFSGALSASKYANPTDEIRHSAHLEK